MKTKILLNLEKQSILNIIEALHFYKDNAIKPKYKPIIDQELIEISKQLTLQGVNVLMNDRQPLLNFGQKVKFENQDAYVLGMSNENEFVKIAIIEDNQLKDIEVPMILLEI